MRKPELDRLLRSAAEVDDNVVPQMPFGFETRVLALWRAQEKSTELPEMALFVRRIAIASFAVLLIASAAAYRELNRSEALSQPLTNYYALADSVIENSFR